MECYILFVSTAASKINSTIYDNKIFMVSESPLNNFRDKVSLNNTSQENKTIVTTYSPHKSLQLL